MAQQPIVIAYHLIWTAYGWWLPNDPRGSGSKTIRTDLIAELGELHYGRETLQPTAQEVRQFYAQASQVLKQPLLVFDAAARNTIAEAFGQVIAEERYTCYACVVMPDHVHILIRKHKHSAEEMMERLKDGSRDRLVGANHCASGHPTWTGGGGWTVFLDHPDEIRRTIGYIRHNPSPLGLPVQEWPFVSAYDGWPLHPGHSPNSPYVQRLRQVGRCRS